MNMFLKALLISSILLLGVYGSLTRSQGADFDWWTLGGSEYRDSRVPLAYGGAYTNGVNIKWVYTLYNGNALGFSITTNPLLIDVNQDQKRDVILTDDAGELIILDGQSGNLFLRIPVNASPFSTPAIVDVDGDGSYELFLSTSYGTIKSYRIDPVSMNLNFMWESTRLGHILPSSPLVYDVNKDGNYEVMIIAPSGFYSLDALSGSIKTYISHAFLVLGSSATLVGDVDGDNIDEVAIADAYGLVALLDPIQGIIEWSIDLRAQFTGFILNSPVLGDVDGDGSYELVVSMGEELFDWIPGTRSDQTTTGLKVARRGFDGIIVVIDPITGSIESVVSANNGSLFAWFSQPAIALGDLNGDGIDDIVLGGGDGWLYYISYDGSSYIVNQAVQLDTYWPQWIDKDAPATASSILLLNIDGDAAYEIVAFSTDNRGGGGVLDYTLYLIDGANINIIDSLTITFNDLGIGSDSEWIYSWPSISAGDVDGDGALEVVAIAYQGVLCFDWQ